MNAYHFWAAILGFLGGVFARSVADVGVAVIGLLISVGIALAAIGYLRASFAKIIAGSLMCIFCALGILRMDGARIVGDETLNGSLDKNIVIEGVVVEEPDVRESNTRISMQVDTVIGSDNLSVSGGVLVIGTLHTDVSYGDRVRAEGVLRLPEAFDAGAGREFNYPAFLAKDGIGYELSFAEIERIGEGRKNWLKAAAIYLKQTYLDGLTVALPEPHAGLAGGITAGDKRGLGSELSDTFRIVGLIHIVVLSGYNIMIVIGFIERVARRLHRYVRISLGVGVAIFFALMTGLASSSVRAASMAVIASAGKMTGRTYLASRALALVAFLMVLWNPWILTFDPGFQLSVIATWGLVFVSPYIAARLSFLTEQFGLREIAATTLGTQIAVLPLLLFQSGQLSIVALPANLLALVAVPWAMLASFVAGVFGIFAGPFAPIVGFPAYALLSYILFIAEWGARVPFAVVSIEAFGVAALFISYVALIALFLSNMRSVPAEPVE